MDRPQYHQLILTAILQKEGETEKGGGVGVVHKLLVHIIRKCYP